MSFIGFKELYESCMVIYSPSVMHRYKERGDNEYDVVKMGACGKVNCITKKGLPYSTCFRITTNDSELVELLLSGRIREYIKPL